MQITDIIFAVAALGAGAALGYFLFGRKKFDEHVEKSRADKSVETARIAAEEVRANSKKQAAERRARQEQEQKEFADQLERLEKLLQTKIVSYGKREEKLVVLKKAIQEEQMQHDKMRDQLKEADNRIQAELVRIIGAETARVKEEIITGYEREFAKDAELRLQRSLELAQEGSVRDAKAILAGILHQYDDPTSVEHEELNITVKQDELKGKIIGRGGGNIAYFEELFGVDVIFNDEPDTITISCFNLVTREIARLALERLMREKIITEAAINAVKPLAEADMDKILFREGSRVLDALGVKNMSSDFARLVGRLKFRTSYGQNIMGHCLEVGYFAQLIAAEIGANEEIALYGGFFHDLGKAIDQEVGGSHDVLSKELLEKYKFSWEITHAAWTHHNAAPQETIEARIVQAADAISASRPGARAESVERYLAKITELQETALSFPGVKKAFAINAGRELRAIVDPEKTNDEENAALAQNIAAKVQEKGGYPGKIKIVTVRIKKVTDYAR